MKVKLILASCLLASCLIGSTIGTAQAAPSALTTAPTIHTPTPTPASPASANDITCCGSFGYNLTVGFTIHVVFARLVTTILYVKGKADQGCERCLQWVAVDFAKHYLPYKRYVCLPWWAGGTCLKDLQVRNPFIWRATTQPHELLSAFTWARFGGSCVTFGLWGGKATFGANQTGCKDQ